MNECYNIVVVVKVSDQRLAIELSFSAGGGLEKPNSGRDRGETFFPDSGSDLDSDETFQIQRNVGLDSDEIVCLLDSQPCMRQEKKLIFLNKNKLTGKSKY